MRRVTVAGAAMFAAAVAPALSNVQSITSGGGVGTTPSGLTVVSSIGEAVGGFGTAPDGTSAGAGFPFLLLTGFTPDISDPFTTSAGWQPFPAAIDGLTTAGFDGVNGALTAVVGPAPVGSIRVVGWRSLNVGSLPYSSVGAGVHVRGKFSLFAQGQTDPAATNQIPNFRVRLANRFAVTSMLTVVHHDNNDPSLEPLGADIAPSIDPAFPSVYRVDLDPPEVPFLVANPTTEFIQRAFEAYSRDPQDNGALALAESSIGQYAAQPDPGAAPASLVKSYSAAGADFALSVFETRKLRLIVAPGGGTGVVSDPSDPQPLARLVDGAITLETTGVPSNRVGVASADLIFGNAGDTNRALRVRVEEGKQYKIRFHATATVASSQNAQIRFRARSVKFAWSQDLSVGGSAGAGFQNNTIASQYLPGIGCLNPDQDTPGEPGGWYTVLFQTPLSKDIRRDAGPNVALTASMPTLANQPGFGIDALSRRDLLLGADVIDGLSTAEALGTAVERGQVTVDQATVQVFDLVVD